MQRNPSGRITLAVGLLAASTIAGLTMGRSAISTPQPAADHGRAARAAGPAAPVVVQVDPDAVSNPMHVQAPLQAVDCPVPGVVRFVSANWECANFPTCSNGRWVAFDQLASNPGLTDEIEWGRTADESTVGTTPDDAGQYGVWSVGGGSVGRNLEARSKDYPGANGKSCRPNSACRINTSLQFNSFDATNVPGGLRVMLDYKAKLPTNARFYVAIADFSKRGGDGTVPIIKSFEAEFRRDTAGEWVRGMTLMFPEAAGVAEVLITFTYINDPVTTDGYGIFIDNVHLDALFNPGAPPCPSPNTPPPPVTDTPTPPTATTKPPLIIMTKTPRPTVKADRKIARMPYVLRNGQARPSQQTATTVPTAPTPTPSATDTLEPTETPLPTWTSRPSDTPQPTPTSTKTPQPVPDVIIDRVLYIRLPGMMAVQIVDLFNQGDGAQNMYRWTVAGTTKVPIRDCRFVDPTVKIEGGEHYYILAGDDAEKQSLVEPYLGRSMVCADKYIFHQTADTVYLADDSLDPVDRYCWYVNGPFECSP